MLAAALAGDLDRSFELLVIAYRVRIVTFVARMMRDDARAEDVAQDVFVRAYRALQAYPAERRAATVRWYLVDNFKLPPANLHTAGYGKQRPKNKANVFAPENRRVEIVNETFQSQARH